jgi:hypothetical protein
MFDLKSIEHYMKEEKHSGYGDCLLLPHLTATVPIFEYFLFCYRADGKGEKHSYQKNCPI